jgi:hypothetical protein
VPDDHLLILLGATGDLAWGPAGIDRLVIPGRWHLPYDTRNG